MPTLLDHVKEYLRIDGDYDDKLVSLLINSAKSYLSNAGVKEQDNDLYQLAITMLVTQWYENREQNIAGKTLSRIDHGLQTIILQLKVGVPNDKSSEV